MGQINTKKAREAFMLINDLATTAGASDALKFDDCWEYKIDEHWEIAVNGHNENRKASDGYEVLASHCYVRFNGWPAGLIGPFGGAFANGLAGGEDAFMKAVARTITGLKIDDKIQIVDKGGRGRDSARKYTRLHI